MSDLVILLIVLRVIFKLFLRSVETITAASVFCSNDERILCRQSSAVFLLIFTRLIKCGVL